MFQTTIDYGVMLGIPESVVTTMVGKIVVQADSILSSGQSGLYELYWNGSAPLLRIIWAQKNYYKAPLRICL